MNRLIRKTASVGLSVTTAVWLTGASMIMPAAAQTPVDINALLQQIAQLQALVAQLQAAQGGGTVTTACTFTRDLTVGSTGTDVQCLQRYLNAAGYQVAASGAGSPGNESTYFGNLTKAAVAKWQAAMGISPAAGYFGPISRAKYTSVAGTTGGTIPGGVVVPASGLAVSLAADNPLPNVLPQGASGVEMLKFNLAGNGTVTGITMKRTGAGKTSDFSAVYLYKGSERLTSGRSINSSSHEVVFTGLNLAVSGVTTLRLVADIDTAATQGDYNAFQVTSVTTSVTVTGLPVSGNEFSISGADAGTITATDQSDGLSNPSVGQANAEVFRFKLTTANEDMKVSRISVFYGGAVSKSNLSNFVLKDLLTGNTLATTPSINDKDLIVFDLTTPYELKKGDSRQFSVYLDVAAGARTGTSETLIFYFEEASDILAIGNQYGYGASVTISDIDSASDYRTNSALTIQTGTLVISFLGPSTGEIAKNAKDLTLFDFKASAVSNIEVRNLRFTVTASTTQAGVDDFKVVDVDSGLVVSGPIDDASGSVVMTDDFVIPAGTTKHFKVTGDTDTNWLNGETIRVTLAAFTASTDLKNLDNNTFLANADVVPNGVAGNTLTVSAPTLTVSAATLPASDSFVKGTTDVPFLGIALRASADTIKVTSIKVSASVTSGSMSEMASDVQSVALYDGLSGPRISDIKSWTTSGTPRTITFSNLSYTIAKGETKTVVVKANLSSSATSGQVYAVTIADTSTDITSLDSDGNSPTLSGSAVNNANGVAITILSGGS
ncbi:MAG TPA: peptidoglycan-binding domain-containing protein, partial [Candidatus Paceibacterota bacterium]|nr:peptidoglycan-binding domain-containing protein [Candidatus Paceibacterota bacterium]